MLPKIVRLNSGLTSRSRWSLALLGFAILSLPTWYQEAQSRQLVPGTGTQPSDSKPAEPKPSDPKPTDGKAATTANRSNGLPGAASKVRDNKAANLRPRAVAGHSGPGHLFAPAVNRPILPAMAAPAVEFFPEPSPIERQLLTALEQDADVDFDFKDVSLDSIFEELRAKHELQFVIDKKSLEEESIPTDSIDITCKVKGIPLRSALDIMLEPKGLTVLVVNNVLKVTTETKARSTMMARTYPVRDLVSNVDADYESLRQAIQTSTGGPEAGSPWAEINGEGGSISLLPATGCLVVSQNARGHQGVLQLLRAIRSANAEAEIKSQHVETNVTK